MITGHAIRVIKVDVCMIRNIVPYLAQKSSDLKRVISGIVSRYSKPTADYMGSSLIINDITIIRPHRLAFRTSGPQPENIG